MSTESKNEFDVNNVVDSADQSAKMGSSTTSRFRRAQFNNGGEEGGQVNLAKHFKDIFAKVVNNTPELTLNVIDGADLNRSVGDNYIAVSLQLGGKLYVHPILITSPTRQMMSVKSAVVDGRDTSELVSYIETVKHGVSGSGDTLLTDVVDYIAKLKNGDGAEGILSYYYISPTTVANVLYPEECTPTIERMIRGILNNAQNCLAVSSSQDYTMNDITEGGQLESRYTFQPDRVLELSDGSVVRADYVATLKSVDRNTVDDITRDNAHEDILGRVYSYITARFIGQADGDVRSPNYDNGQFMPLLNIEIDLESPDLKEGAIIERGLACLSMIPAQLSNGRWKLQYTPDTITEGCRISDFYFGFHPLTVDKLPTEVMLDKLEKDEDKLSEFVADRVWRDEDLVDVAMTVNDHQLGSAFSQLFLDISIGEEGAKNLLINALHDRYTNNGKRRPEVVRQVESILRTMTGSDIVIASSTQLVGTVGSGAHRPSSVIDPLFIFGKLGRNYGAMVDDYIELTSFEGSSMPESQQDITMLGIMSKVTNDCFVPTAYETKVIITAYFMDALARLNAITGHGVNAQYDYNGTIAQHNRRNAGALSGMRAGVAGHRNNLGTRSHRPASNGRYRS